MSEMEILQAIKKMSDSEKVELYKELFNAHLDNEIRQALRDGLVDRDDLSEETQDLISALEDQKLF